MMQMEQNKKLSMLGFGTAMLVFGTVGIFRRMTPIPSAVLACFRGAIGAVFLLIVMLVRKKTLRFHVSGRQAVWLAVTGMLIGLNWILLFDAYSYTTVATATLCYYMQPTIVILLSPLVFKERLTRRKGFCALLAVVGMVLISGVAENGLPQPGEAKGILFALGAAMLYATVVILNKKLQGIDAYEKTVIQLAAAAAVMVPWLFTPESRAIEWNAAAVVPVLIMGLVHTGISYALYFGCMDGLKAQTVAIFSYIDPIVALLLSSFLLGETMTVFGIVGTVLILGATAVSELLPEHSV